MGYVYKITNTRNNKSYIGISIHEPTNGRIRHHLSGYGNQCIANAVKKYGKDAFTYEVLEANVFDEFLPDLEVAYIAEFNTFVPNGYNLTRGGGVKWEKYRKGKKRKKGKNFNYYKMGAVAYLFINEPEKTVKEIADAVGIRENTVHQWQAKGEWDKALDAFNFTGDRSLRRKASRDLERESGDVIDLAKSTYRDARAAGMRKGEASRQTAKVVNVSEKTIFNWRKRFAWDEEGTDGNQQLYR